MVVFLKFPEAKWRMPGMQEGGAYAMIPCTTALVFQDAQAAGEKQLLPFQSAGVMRTCAKNPVAHQSHISRISVAYQSHIVKMQVSCTSQGGHREKYISIINILKCEGWLSGACGWPPNGMRETCIFTICD